MRSHGGDEADVAGSPLPRGSRSATPTADEERKRLLGFICDREGCGKAFWTKQHLVRHQELHDRPSPSEEEQVAEMKAGVGGAKRPADPYAVSYSHLLLPEVCAEMVDLG